MGRRSLGVDNQDGFPGLPRMADGLGQYAAWLIHPFF